MNMGTLISRVTTPNVNVTTRNCTLKRYSKLETVLEDTRNDAQQSNSETLPERNAADNENPLGNVVVHRKHPTHGTVEVYTPCFSLLKVVAY